MTNLKMNYKGIYDSQDDILKCKEILKISKEEDNIPNYERLRNSTGTSKHCKNFQKTYTN